MASILFCGSEGEYAAHTNTLSGTGSDDKRRGSVTLTPSDEIYKPFTASKDLWARARIASGSTFFVNSQVFFEIRTAASAVLCGVRSTNGSPYTTIFTRKQLPSDANVDHTEEYAGGTADVFLTYDINVQIFTTTTVDDTIRYRLYRESVLRLDEQYISTDGAWSPPAQLLLRSMSSGLGDARVQDVIFTDGIPTVGMELATLTPTGVGNYTAFTNDYTAVDESGFDATDAVTTTSTGQRESWTFPAATFTLGDRQIYGLAAVNVGVLDQSGTIADFEPFLRISGTDYAGGAMNVDSIAPTAAVHVYQTNPNTGIAWVYADLNAEAGVHSI